MWTHSGTGNYPVPYAWPVQPPRLMLSRSCDVPALVLPVQLSRSSLCLTCLTRVP